MKVLNVEFFRAAEACYDPATVLGEDWIGTIADILRMENIPAKDRIWAATRPEVLDEKTLRLLACRCVRETPIGNGRTVWDLLPKDGPGRAAVETAERFARGESSMDELRAAAEAAYAAAVAATYVFDATSAATYAASTWPTYAFAATAFAATAAAKAAFSAAATAKAASAKAASAKARQAQVGFFLEEITSHE